jgi:hypothetical protein
VSLVGNIYGIGKYLGGNYNKVEGLNGWDNFVNTVLDNDVTRYGHDIVTHGTLYTD